MGKKNVCLVGLAVNDWVGLLGDSHAESNRNRDLCQRD